MLSGRKVNVGIGCCIRSMGGNILYSRSQSFLSLVLCQTGWICISVAWLNLPDPGNSVHLVKISAQCLAHGKGSINMIC